MRKTLAFRPASQFEVTLGSASEAFRLRCQAQNLSTGTLAWYKQILKMFGQFVEAKGAATARAVTPTLLRQHLEDMRTRGNSTVTIARTYGGLRCFFGFLTREQMIPQNPCLLVEKPRTERKLIRPLSIDQVRLLLAQCNQKRYDEHRLWTIMVLIFDSGLRISEVIGLRKDAIDFQSGVLRVMGKGGKERQVPFGLNAKRALWSYTARRGEIPDQDLFFVSRFGGRCCRYLLRKEFHRLGAQAGIQGVRVSPHTMRHTFATQYIMNGGDAFSLQQIDQALRQSGQPRRGRAAQEVLADGSPDRQGTRYDFQSCRGIRLRCVRPGRGEKFGSRYLFMEYHYDTGAPFGTVCPLKKLGMAPKDLPLSAHLETVDKATMRCVEFDRPIADGGKGWYFLDTGKASERIHAVTLPNKKLFKFLASVEKTVMAKCKKCRHRFTPSWLDKNGRCPMCEIRIKHER